MAHDGSAHLVLVNPPISVLPGEGVSIVRAGTLFPLAARSVRGVAVDAGCSARFGTQAAAELVQAGGRLVAPHDSRLPSDATQLVSDDRHWVAEVNHPPQTVVAIARRR
jgi:hypothetical protein